MSTFNGEPYEGFFKRENETDEQYLDRQSNRTVSFDVLVDENAVNYSATFVEAPHPDIIALREEVAELRDTLNRTEDFVNSLLRNKAVSEDIKVIKTPINIPARRAQTNAKLAQSEDFVCVFGEQGQGRGSKVEQLPGSLRVIKPKKVRNNEDYERAMSLVGK